MRIFLFSAKSGWVAVRWWSIVALCVSLVFLFGCSRETTHLRVLKHDASILAFGDSLTFGTGAGSQENYPAVLSQLISRHVVTSGVPGEVSSEGLKRLPQALQRHAPSLLILCHGGNDLLRKLDKNQLKQNLSAMVELAKSMNIDVVLLGVPEPTLLLQRTAPLYFEVAKELNVPIEGKAVAEIVADRALKSDPIHPNAEGYRQLAHAVAMLLREHGAVR